MGFNKVFNEYVDSCPSVKTVIHWYDLYDGHYVTLKKEFQKQLFKRAIQKAGNYSILGEKLGFGRKTISGCCRGIIRPQLGLLKKILRFINYDLKDINKRIVRISNLQPNLPFNMHSIEGAEIRAAFLSDGHVDKNPTKPAQYCAFEIELHERLIKLCHKVFGKFNTHSTFRGKTHNTKLPSVLGQALVLSGVPRGAKRLSNCYVPKDIISGDQKICSAYLRRVFDDEGDVCFDLFGKCAVRISRSLDVSNAIKNRTHIPFQKWIRKRNSSLDMQHNLIFGERLMLLKLGIDAKLYLEGVYKSRKTKITAKWRIQMGQQDSLKKFAELVNFTLITKKEKLKKAINSYKFRKLPNGEGKKQALSVLTQVYREKGFIPFSDLGKTVVNSGRSYNLAGRYLKFFSKSGKIKKIKRGIYTLNDRT